MELSTCGGSNKKNGVFLASVATLFNDVRLGFYLLFKDPSHPKIMEHYVSK